VEFGFQVFIKILLIWVTEIAPVNGVRPKLKLIYYDSCYLILTVQCCSQTYISAYILK